MFSKFIDAIRGFTPQTHIVDSDGKRITDENISELKKSELIDYIGLLREDREKQKEVLNNLEGLKKSFSEELYNDAEDTTLAKIIDIDKAIVKAEGELSNLKMKFADAIIFNNEGKILFLKRSDNSSKYPGKYGLPGGHIDAGEDAETAVKRELAEEANLTANGVHLVGELKTKDVEISYFMISIDPEELLILDNSEHYNWKWCDLEEINDTNAIPGLRDKLEQITNPVKASVKVLKKAFEQGLITEDRYLGALSKAAAQIGEIREWSGQKMKKEASGWVPVTEGKGGAKEDDKKGPRGKKEEGQKRKPGEDKKGGEKEGPTPEQLSMHAKETDSDTLRQTAEDPNAEPSLQQAAAAELEERGEKPSIKQRLKEKASVWHKKQVEMYQSGALDAGSDDRKGLSGWLSKKKDGIIKQLMHEKHTFQGAGSGLKKFFTGNKGEITSSEKKAMKTIGIHLGIVVGSMALTGGLGGLATKGIGALGKGIAMHYLEHQGITSLGHVLAFAKAEGEEELSDAELEKYIGMLVDGLLEHIEHGNISEEDWMDIGDSSKDDFATISEEEEATEELESDDPRFEDHAKEHDEEHINKMKEYMEAGATFEEAHEAAMEKEEGGSEEKEDKEEK